MGNGTRTTATRLRGIQNTLLETFGRLTEENPAAARELAFLAACGEVSQQVSLEELLAATEQERQTTTTD